MVGENNAKTLAVGITGPLTLRAAVDSSWTPRHVAQCARDIGGQVWSHHAVFARIARAVDLRLFVA